MAIVVPAENSLSDTAKLLLELADNPRDVRTAGNGLEFDVPDELADRYHALLSGAPVPEQQDAPKTPAKRRGRPPRVTEEE